MIKQGSNTIFRHLHKENENLTIPYKSIQITLIFTVQLNPHVIV